MKFIKLIIAMLLMALAQVSRAEEEAAPDAAHDQKVEIEALKEAVEGLTAKTEYLDKFHMEGFTDIRVDDSQQSYKNPVTGSEGMYVRRAEMKIAGKLAPAVTYSFGFDFAELKMKDMGVEIADIQLIPFMDVTPEWTYMLKIGQYRQPFGIVPQTSSSKIYLAERPIIFGGALLANPGSGDFKFSPKMIGERIMGAFVFHKKKLVENVLSWEVQGAVSNDNTEDQASGSKALTGFSNQVNDESPTWQARAVLGLDFVQSWLPEKSKLNLGASYVTDSRNTAWKTGNPTKQANSGTFGCEALLELANKMLILQSEYLHASNLDSTGTPLLPVSRNRTQDGFYADAIIDVLPMFTTPTPGDAVQFIFRIERYWEQDVAATVGPLPRYGYANLMGLAGGIKWSYMGGKNHTAINYYVQANDGMFGGYTAPEYGPKPIGAPASLLLIQQQFAFE